MTMPMHPSTFGLTACGRLFCLAGIVLALPALAEPSCANPAITSPADESTVASVRPTIHWQAVAGVASYRLQLVSREPEGRTLATIDTLVSDTRFVPPQALSDGFALISVSVTSQCPAGASSSPSPGRDHRFLIDARSACTVAGIALDSTERRLRWAVTPGADRYEVFAYDPGDGRLLFRQETSLPAVVPPSPATGPVVVAIRPRCGEVFGQTGYFAY